MGRDGVLRIDCIGRNKTLLNGVQRLQEKQAHDCAVVR